VKAVALQRVLEGTTPDRYAAFSRFDFVELAAGQFLVCRVLPRSHGRRDCEPTSLLGPSRQNAAVSCHAPLNHALNFPLLPVGHQVAAIPKRDCLR